MLSPESAAVVRATLPVVGGAIGEITPRFYQRMFAAHPELRDRLFNQGNQARGEQQQALAGAIAAFATMLVERPGAMPDAMLARIAGKHASLGVTEDQYPIVHEHLFGAIVEVLGDAVTPEVAAAWDEVYWLMARVLIGMEKNLYTEAGVTGEGVWREWKVIGRSEETAQVASFEITPADGGPAPAGKPGQYVSVAVELPGGRRQIRQYSLSGAPGGSGGNVRRITVKREDGEPAGEVSTWLHHNVRPGDTLTVSPPFGDLVLHDGDAPLLLVSAGIGVTPMIGMLEHLVDTGATRPVTVVHADRSPETHPLREDLGKLTGALPDARLHVWYEQETEGYAHGRADLASLRPAPETEAYLCGPLPFMREMRAQLIDAGVPADAIRYEVFGPDMWIA